MNRSGIRFFLVILMVLAFSAACSRRVSDGTHILNIYVTSDVHGCCFSRHYPNDSVKGNSLSKVSSILRKEREGDPDLILIDNGDNLQGDNSAFYFNFVDTVSPHLFARVANYLEYDATVVGNHDIEAGHPVFDRIRRQYNMPMLGANAIRTEAPDAGKAYFDEYTIVEKNGLRVAIIGTTNAYVTHWVTEPLYRGIEFRTNGQMLQQLVDRVRAKEKPDFVIVATHSGSGEEDVESEENDALFQAKHLSGVDLVIGGHDHKPRVADYGQTAYLNPGARCRYLGHARFRLTYAKGKRVSAECAAELIPMENVAPDPAYDAVFEDDYRKVKQFTMRRICSVGESFSLADALTGPSAYMKLLYDVQLAASGAQLTFAAPLTSSGTIERGDLVYNDLTRIYPFENKLFTIELTGKQIKDYLESSYDRWIRNDGPAYCYDSAGGLRYKVFRSRDFGSRVEIEAFEDGTAFEMDRSYRVAVTSYRAMGGDGLLASAGVDITAPDSYIVDRQGDIRDLLFDYLSAIGTLEPEICANWQFVD